MKNENIYKSFTLTLQTLTPLHVGNGEALNDLDYFFDSGTYYRVTQNQFLDFLEENQIPLSKYTDWIAESVIDDEKIRDYRKENPTARDTSKIISELKADFRLNRFCEKYKIDTQFQEYLKKNLSQIMHCSVPKAIDLEFNRSEKANEKPKEIRGHIRKATGEVYLPGTSIKGAIRTALLYYFVRQKSQRAKIVNELENIKRKYQKKKVYQRTKQELAQPLEQLCFFCGKKTYRDKYIKYDDVQLDLMKLLSIGDASPLENSEKFSLANVNLYVLQDDPEKAKEQVQTPIVEVIPEGKELISQIDFNIDFLFHIKNSWRLDREAHYYISMGDDDKYWIDIDKKVKALFNLDISTLTKENLAEKREGVLKHILAQVQKFSEDRLKHDATWLDAFGKSGSQYEFISEIKKGYRPVELEEKSCFTQIGFATGFHGVTQMLAFLPSESEEDNFKNLFEEVLLTMDIGKNLDLTYFPRSRRLSKEEEIAFSPLGFVKILSPELLPQPSIENNEQSDEGSTFPLVEMEAITDNQTEIYAEIIGKKKVKLFIKDQDVEAQLVLNPFQKKLPLKEGDILKVQVVQRKGDGSINQVKLIEKV